MQVDVVVETLVDFSSWGFLSFYLALVSGAQWMMAREVCIAYGFVVALNVDDARRWIGAGAYFAERTVLQ